MTLRITKMPWDLLSVLFVIIIIPAGYLLGRAYEGDSALGPKTALFGVSCDYCGQSADVALHRRETAYFCDKHWNRYRATSGRHLWTVLSDYGFTVEYL